MADVSIPNPDPPRVPPPTVIGHCPYAGCGYTVGAFTHDAVFAAIVTHLRTAHGAKES